MVVALHGELGAGKSVLARAIARGAGVQSAMPSPTFNLLFRYESPRADVYHYDLYRLRSPSEVWELSWSEIGDDDQLVLIEWPERAESLLPPDRWDVAIAGVPDQDQLRDVRATPAGNPPELPTPE